MSDLAVGTVWVILQSHPPGCDEWRLHSSQPHTQP